MHEYSELFGLFERLIANRGIDVVTSDAFTGLVLDYYRFEHQTKLREAFINASHNGIVRQAAELETPVDVSLMADKVTITLSNGEKRDYAAIIYGIAIARGVCSIDNFERWLDANTQPVATRPAKKKPHMAPKNKRAPLSIEEQYRAHEERMREFEAQGLIEKEPEPTPQEQHRAHTERMKAYEERRKARARETRNLQWFALIFFVIIPMLIMAYCSQGHTKKSSQETVEYETAPVYGDSLYDF